MSVRIADIGDAMADATARLRAAGIDDPRREARLLVAHALGFDPAAVLAYPERAVGLAERAVVESLVTRRADRVPIAQLLGTREFWSLPFAVTSDVLTPRPESETLIAAALEHSADRPLRLLDLGSGSGCLLLALLSERPSASGVGVDASAAAVVLARQNAAALGLAGRAAFRVGDWSRAPAGPFDVIVCNPPYVAGDEIAELDPEVARHEPRAALDGGSDGLAAYRVILPVAADRLAAAGIAVLELGFGQYTAVAALARAAGLAMTTVRKDLAGVPRALVLARR